jgi:hypothetical protein
VGLKLAFATAGSGVVNDSFGLESYG